MPARKMRVELFDSEGNRYTVAFEGQITRDKALRLFDMIELLGGLPNGETNSEMRQLVSGEADVSTKYDKVSTLVRKHFPIVWFSSKDVQRVYEQGFKEPIGLSTISTYLSRQANKGLLQKTGRSNNLKYRVSSNSPPVTIKHPLYDNFAPPPS